MKGFGGQSQKRNNKIKKPSKEQIINQAFLLHSKGKIAEATKFYQYFINQGFKNHRVFTNYGAILQGHGKLQEAKLLYRKAIEIKPDFADAYSNLGSIYRVLGNLQEAELYTRKAIEIKPDYEIAYSNLGNILKDLGNLEEAELSYRKVIEIKPDYEIAYSNLGNILKDLGNLEEAELYTRKAIELKPNYANAFLNLGNILKDLGNLEEAELSYRKVIEIKPNYADAYANLGSILSDLGKLQDAELYTRKAIELKPNYADAFFNLGNILKDLGNLEEAELSYRKVIEIKPNYADAYANLGSILSDLGKLQDAELYTRKAIELKPDHAAAYDNLGFILSDLGKLKELLHLSKSILKSKSINKEYKLLASIRITIANLLRGDFSETLLSINKTNNLINQGAMNAIKDEQNKKFAFSFSRFIYLLYPLLEKENKYSNSIIPHFGESHCLSFAHQTLSISSQLSKIQPVHITGGKAWHFANNGNNRWKDSLNHQVKNHTYSNKAFISFGEIDCRKDEGILNYAINNDKDIVDVCEKTIKGYLDYMENKLTPIYSKKYYFGVPAPTKQKELFDDLDIKRIKMIQMYNSILKKEVLVRGSYFLDVYNLTADNEGVNNNIHMCDEFHLSPKCLSNLFENYLHKT